MSTLPPPPAFTPFAEPTRRVPGRWIALFATAWLGIWMAQLTPIQLLLPQQVEGLRGESDWVSSVVAFGIISAIAGACALVVFPLTGALSDRTTSRFGRRKPWIAAGTLVFAVSLALLGLQSTMVGVGVFWSLALSGFCMASAAVTATIADQVPVEQRGFVSAWVSAPQAIGTVLGIVLVLILGLGLFGGYALVAGLLIVLVAPFLLATTDEALPAVLRPPFRLRMLVTGLWISPRQHPDFAWTLLGRVLVNIGNALGTTLLLYFIAFGLERGDTAEDDLLVLTMIYLVFFTVAALTFGRISDRFGQRKPFVYVAAYLQALAALLLAIAPDYTIAMVAAAFLGIGYGSFMSVDQALATQVLPDRHTRGKDLGIMNVAMAVPQAVGPLLGAMIVAAAGGFTALFVAAAIAATLGGLAVLPIKSVR